MTDEQFAEYEAKIRAKAQFWRNAASCFVYISIPIAFALMLRQIPLVTGLAILPMLFAAWLQGNLACLTRIERQKRKLARFFERGQKQSEQ